ncbi:enteropeptidase [Nelusetta ayraudi]|uniref:enteropeptidase n=1 Tax=Nelusetta ayraudi TaxID=303726 RepID=UPI003F704B40
MRRKFTSLEVCLSVISVLLSLCCIGLIVYVCIGLKDEGTSASEPMRLSGRLTIKQGAEFSEELKNSSSPGFKSLSVNIQNLVSEAFSHSQTFESCQVLSFSQGSVVVNFDLQFNEQIGEKEARQQLIAGLQEVESTEFVIDTDSIQISEIQDETTAAPTTASTTNLTTAQTTAGSPTVTCNANQRPCNDGSKCVLIGQFCDGVIDCPGAFDEDAALCATPCDKQFLLTGPNGSFSASGHQGDTPCRWLIRVDRGLSIEINFQEFHLEQDLVFLNFYEGIGESKQLTAKLTGSIPPGTVWLLADQSTAEFVSDYTVNPSGFSATYRAANTSSLSDEQRLSCTFEQGMCFWRQSADNQADWARVSGPTFPLLTGPSGDHTLENGTGFYLVTPPSRVPFERSFKMHSLPLTPTKTSMCLSFWYHMYGADVHLLKVQLRQTSSSNTTTVFQKEGDYGDNWNYGQVPLHLTEETTVVFEALKKGGLRNDIALDDIQLTSEPCGPAPPDPTKVPPPTTTPPIPPDCGGPFDLWEPNTTFSSPNYPNAYGHNAECLWTLHTSEGRNIQLHFLDFDIEMANDVVEVRDGTGSDSMLLAVLTGDKGPTHDLYSTTNQMSVWFITNKSGYGRGFRANFTSGVGLGLPAPCADDQFQCHTGTCINSEQQCNGVVDCPDASDEADCVELQVNSSNRLQFRLGSSLFAVCADAWNSHLSVFTCRHLGYRFGEATLLPALPQDSLFANITVTSDDTLETSVSETCGNDKVISLSCDNQPCGVAPQSNRTDQSAHRIPGEVEGRVVGGVNAEKGAWPWIVSLHWNDRHACGASVIGRDWLLTAAHCVHGKNIHFQSWLAIFGLHAQSGAASPDVQTRRVDRIIMHPHYNRQTKQADIALMHLQQPINFTEFIQPVCLPPEGQNYTVGKKSFIAGWGRDADQNLPDVLQEAEVPLLPQDQCQRSLPQYNITSSMLCAGYPEGGVDSCQGDSGGPLMCEDDGHWSAIGVVSFGEGCGLPQKPGVYVRVSSFTTWIAQARRSMMPDSYID